MTVDAQHWGAARVFMGWRPPLAVRLVVTAFWPAWIAHLALLALGVTTAEPWLAPIVQATGWAQLAVLAIGLPRLFATARLSRGLRASHGLRKDTAFILAAAPRIARARRPERWRSLHVRQMLDVGDFMGLIPGRAISVIRDDESTHVVVADDSQATPAVLAELRALPHGAAILRALGRA